MDRVNPMPGQVLHYVENLNGCGYSEDDREVTDIAQANTISSKVQGSDKHKILLDIDLPVQVIPSSTPGHGHLYIDKEVSLNNLCDLMNILVDMGVLEEGYRNASERRGYTSLRLPWVRKENA